jgi:hypothetical protein
LGGVGRGGTGGDLDRGHCGAVDEGLDAGANARLRAGDGGAEVVLVVAEEDDGGVGTFFRFPSLVRQVRNRESSAANGVAVIPGFAAECELKAKVISSSDSKVVWQRVAER